MICEFLLSGKWCQYMTCVIYWHQNPVHYWLDWILVPIYDIFIILNMSYNGTRILFSKKWLDFGAYLRHDSHKHSLKVFRLKAAILSLQFVNLVMFYSSLLSKTCLNVYRPTSPILFLLGTSCNLLSSVPVVPRRAPPGLPLVSSGLPCTTRSDSHK